MPHLRQLLHSRWFFQYPHQIQPASEQHQGAPLALRGAMVLTHHPSLAAPCWPQFQPESGRCQDGQTVLHNVVVLSRHPLLAHPCWPQLQSKSGRCQDVPLPLRHAVVLRPYLPWPLWAAKNNGDLPLSASAAFLSAPASSNRRMGSRWPCIAAWCTGWNSARSPWMWVIPEILGFTHRQKQKKTRVEGDAHDILLPLWGAVPIPTW